MAQEQEKNQETKSEPKKEGFLGRFHPIELVVYGRIGFGTLVTSYTMIGRKFMEFVNKNGYVKELLDKKRQDHANLAEKIKDSIKNNEPVKNFIKESAKIEKEYSAKLNELFGKMGVKSTFNQFRALKMHNQLQIAFNVIGVALIGALAIVFIRKEHKHKQNLEPQQTHKETGSQEVEYDIPEKTAKLPLGKNSATIIAQQESQNHENHR